MFDQEPVDNKVTGVRTFIRNLFTSSGHTLRRYLAVELVAGASFLGVGGAAAINETSAQANIAPKVVAGHKYSPIRPINLENHLAYDLANFSPNAEDAYNGLQEYLPSISEVSYRGDILGDVETYDVKPHYAVAIGPKNVCNNQLSEASYTSLSLSGMRSNGCPSYDDTGSIAIKPYCETQANGGMYDGTVQECEAVNLAPGLNMAGATAAKSVGLQPDQYGNTSEIKITGFNKKAVVDFTRGNNPGVRQVRSITLIPGKGHSEKVKLSWYR